MYEITYAAPIESYCLDNDARVVPRAFWMELTVKTDVPYVFRFRFEGVHGSPSDENADLLPSDIRFYREDMEDPKHTNPSGGSNTSEVDPPSLVHSVFALHAHVQRVRGRNKPRVSTPFRTKPERGPQPRT